MLLSPGTHGKDFLPYFVSGSEIAGSKGMNIFSFIKCFHVFCKEDVPVYTSDIRV